MRVLLALASLVALSTGANAQFTAPLPPPLAAKDVVARTFRAEFAEQLTADDSSVLAKADQSAERLLVGERDRFCASKLEGQRNDCVEALTLNALEPFLSGNPPPSSRVLLSPGLPFTHAGYEIVNYLQATNATGGISLFSQFAANVSDNEAFVVTNIIRGLAGRPLVSIDYAAVVAKAEAANEADAEIIEDDKATIIRMVNNGGTVVGKVFAPIYAIAGQTLSSTAGINLTAGGIGSMDDTESLDAAGGVVLESMNSVALRTFTGTQEIQGELVLGVRGGYARSDAPLLQNGTSKGIGYGQFAIGLRRGGALTLSALITWTQSEFTDYVPKLQVNFSAVR